MNGREWIGEGLNFSGSKWKKREEGRLGVQWNESKALGNFCGSIFEGNCEIGGILGWQILFHVWLISMFDDIYCLAILYATKNHTHPKSLIPISIFI